MKDKFYTVKEAAGFLGYSTNTIYGYLRTGEIKSVRVGRGKYRIPASELAKFESGEEVNLVKDEIPSTILPEPRPGKSLEALSGETPWHILKLWLAERVGLPRLFDWMVALASIVLGLSMFLYNRQLDVFVGGNVSDWFLPIRLTLILAGFGLILADMIQDEFSLYKHTNNIFRVILVLVYFSLAYMQMRVGDMDGLIINGLFGSVILLESVFGLMSSIAYAVYVGGLAIGIVLAFRYYPNASGLSSISTAIYRVIDGYSVFLNVFVLIVLLFLIWGYFMNRKFLKLILGFFGLLLLALSVHYAAESYWARAYFVLIAAMIGMLLPFWEKFKNLTEIDRTLAFRMFGTILMTFTLSIGVIGIVQSVLLRSAKQNLAEKVDYGRNIVDRAVEDSFSALTSLSGNPQFRQALLTGNEEDLRSLTKTFFESYQDFESISIVNREGGVVAMYPSEEEMPVDFSGLGYPNSVVGGGYNYFSSQLEEYPFGGEDTVVVGVPVRQANGEIVGGVFASYNLRVLDDRLRELASQPLEQHFGILDIDGVWLSNENADLVGTKVAEIDVTYLSWLTNKELNTGYNGSGRYSVVAIKAAKNVNWTVTLAQPIFAVMDISKSGSMTVMFLFFIGAVVVVSVYAFVRTEEKNA